MYIISFKLLKQISRIAYKLRLLIIRSFNILFILLIEIYKRKLDWDINILEHKNKTNNKDKVISIIYYKVNYRKS